MTEAERVQAAKAKLAPENKIAYPKELDAIPPPSADQLVQAYANQSGVAPVPDAAPARSAEPAWQPEAPPPVPVNPEPYGGGGAGNTPAGVARSDVPAEAQPNAGAEGAPASTSANPQASPSRASEADRIAAARAEMNRLNAEKGMAARARLEAGSAPRAIIVDKGGMRPSGEAYKIEQGPQVQGADKLLADIEQRGTAANAGTAKAEAARDSALLGLQEQNTAATAKFAGEEAKINQASSDALAKVSERMQKAIDSANVPVVSPAQDLNEMGIGQKLAFALAAAGGGIAGRATGTNPFLQGFDQVIDQRIKTQEQQVAQAKGQAAEQQNLYGVLRKGFDDDAAARAGLRVMYLQALDSKLKETALHFGLDTNDPRYQALQAGLSQQLLTEREKLAQLSGQKLSQEKTFKQTPPQVVTIGGASKAEQENRAKLHEALLKEGLLDKKADLDALNNVIRNADSSGAIRSWIAEHPGHSTFDAIAALSADPTQKQFVVDLQHNVKQQLGDKGMRSEGGQAIVRAIDNPAMAQQAYNREAHDYADRAAAVIDSIPDGWGVYNRSLANQQDIRSATESPVNPIGSEPLPSSIPEVTNPPPAPIPATPVAVSGTEKKGRRKH